MKDYHKFHIPVMGTAFTAETPLRVAQFGINSVVSIVDDVLLERLRKVYCESNGYIYDEITNENINHRADRITSYLNLINKLTTKKFEEFINSTKEKFEDIKKYFSLLPNSSEIKKEFYKIIGENFSFDELKEFLKENLSIGSIDVNIMTKVDKQNFYKKEALSVEYNDAHAALRGYAESDLESSIIFSAGMNPRLYGYIANFKDFFPDVNGKIKKKIVLKVSDYRSAIIQGKFLAKKGLWVSEYRIESGLNCGGHAFATDGLLMGPILNEFRENRQTLIDDTFEILIDSLKKSQRTVPNQKLNIKITAQGGVGTSDEQNFLINYYNLDSVGWGTPFLLVPEVTTVDAVTREKLLNAKEEDLYLSKVSPLGVPFNNLKNNTKDIERDNKIEEGKPGSSCPRRFLALSQEYDEQGICTASRKFQKIKIKESSEDQSISLNNIFEKTCLCVGLAAPAIINNNINAKDSKAVSICPGPNLAYFSNEMSLQEISQHIYGIKESSVRKDRPHFFVKELELYVKYLKEKIDESTTDFTKKQEKYFHKFLNNMNEGIDYYNNLFKEMKSNFSSGADKIIESIKKQKFKLDQISKKIDQIKKELA
tara:strand:+ start:456 stop:2246 length:1791 start_codon:yes stop_codon:yes gene_type:complete